MNELPLGPLAVALAKAQAAFPAIPRDKKVVVQKKTGGSYEFKYAPLESIIAATRGPLYDNGLAVAQLIDSDALVTMLLHESGAYLEARTMIPSVPDIQGFGSAITYLRRYAITAILGIATEEDDDGNRAAGNTMVVKPDVERTDDGGLIGIVQVGDRAKSSDFLLYNEAETGHYLGFRLRGEKGGILVRTYGQLARDLMTLKAQVVGQRVTVWGKITDVPGEGKMKGYTVLDAERVSVPGLPPLPTALNEPAPVEAASDAMFDDLERIGA